MSGWKLPKFDWATVEKIRRDYKRNREKKKNEIRNGRRDRISTYTLSADYDCSQSTMHGIVTYQTYRTKPESDKPISGA